MKGSYSAFFRDFYDLFWCWPNFQGLFPYLDIFSRTAREIGIKIGHKLALTYHCYPRVFQVFFRPSKNSHFY